jgi:hypothetical protein
MTELESSRRVHSDLSLQNTANIMSTSMATYLAQTQRTRHLSAENWRNLHNFILCMCAKSGHSVSTAIVSLARAVFAQRIQRIAEGK